MPHAMKLVTIVGARPQFIKCAPVCRELRKVATEVLVHTGQHYDENMSAVFFRELDIPEPDYNLGVGSGPQGHQTGEMLERIEEVLLKERPDVVLVYGDTNSTLAGALAAAKLHIPVAHVEAGLRSFNKRMPEEINRVLTDHVSTYLFCPSETAVENLRREGFAVERQAPCTAVSPRPINDKLEDLTPQEALHSAEGGQPENASPDIDHPWVVQVGDVMYDMLIHALDLVEEKSRILDKLGIAPKGYDLLTLHRAETTDDPRRLDEVIAFVNEISAQTPVIFPMHPRMAKVYSGVRGPFTENVRIIEPLGYFDLLMALKNARRLMTDSGGMQKEAYWLQVPCITFRDETEWVETVQSGWNILWRDYRGAHHPKGQPHAYGDGHAAENITKTFIIGVADP